MENNKVMKSLNWVKRLFKKEVKLPVLLAGILFTVLVAFLPLFIISIYNHPCADDLTYGFYPHVFFKSTGSLLETMSWNLYQVKATYDTWQGTFSSAFFMGLSPAVFSEKIYWLSPVIMFSMIITSTVYILKVILVDVLKTDKLSYGIVSAITVFIIIEQMHWPAQGLYWFNASVHYTFMHSVMLFLLGNGIQFILRSDKKQKIRSLVFASFFAFICSGSNYVTALSGILLMALIVLIGVIMIKKKAFFLLIPLGIYIVGFYFNVTAYGNNVRQAYFEKQTPLIAILNSFITAVRRMDDWFSYLLLFLMIMLIPVIWNMVSKISFRFLYPLLVSTLSFLVFAAMFSPSHYALNSEGVARTLNIIKMLFQLLMILNEVYWIGWIVKKLKEKNCSIQLPHFYIFYGFMALLMILVFYTSPNREGQYISYGGYTSLVTGQAKTYHEEYLKRLEVLESDNLNPVLEPFTQKPFLLYVDDIVSDPMDWRNMAMSNWYGKETVKLQVTEE